MKSYGHVTKKFSVGGSVVVGVARKGKHLQANSDFRKAGHVDGF